MKFGEKIKRAIKKIKGKIIVFGILILIILVWGVAPLVRAYVNASTKSAEGNSIMIYSNFGAKLENIGYEEAERRIAAGEMERDQGMTVFVSTLLLGLGEPLVAFVDCLQVEPVDYLSIYLLAVEFTAGVSAVLLFIGICRAIPKNEYEDIENGSSDWCEGGEQYSVLHKKKGIVLAEKNYLPVDKRGNVIVLVVRRVWCW